MEFIRPAVAGDASRIAEILVFAKRTHYREIFHDDEFSFNVLQVAPLAREYAENPAALDGIFVYDDGIVRGMVHISGNEVRELYVDTFFQKMGVGRALLTFAVENFGADNLWVLEKNARAIGFYEKMGFCLTDERKLNPGTPEYIVKMKKPPLQ